MNKKKVNVEKPCCCFGNTTGKNKLVQGYSNCTSYQNFCTFIWHQVHFRSNNNDSPRSVGRMHHPESYDVTPVSVSSWLVISCGLWEPALLRHHVLEAFDQSAARPARWTGTEAEQALWRSQSSVTDKVIMLLLFAFKAVIKCDRDCLAAAPTGRQWSVQQQGGDMWRIIRCFQFGSKKAALLATKLLLVG